MGAMLLPVVEAELVMEMMEMKISCTHCGVQKWLFCGMFVWVFIEMHSMALHLSLSM